MHHSTTPRHPRTTPDHPLHSSAPGRRPRWPTPPALLAAVLSATALVVAGLAAAPAHSAAPARGDRATMPARITQVHDRPGRRAGETRISWRTSGRHTTYFRIETALTPFGRGRPRGWHSHVFRVGGHRRAVTLTPRQVAAAGAPLGSGRHLLFRVYAVHRGHSGRQVRPFRHIRSADISGHASMTRGARIRVASYNVRLATLDAGTAHSWVLRAPLVAANLASHLPTVAAMQELIPSMWTGKAGGVGLHRALRHLGLGAFRLTRHTTYSRHIAGDARILYDSSRLRLLGHCRQRRPSCGFVIPNHGHRSVASWAKFRDRASGAKFLFVSTHLAQGNSARLDRLRATEARIIIRDIHRVNPHHLPVILGGDLNSCQTCAGHNRPHRRLLRAGFYDTSAAATQVNLQYNSRNDYATPEVPSANGFGARLDAVLTTGMPGADRFEMVRTGAPYPSDHNLVYADLRLPRR